jgi:hypothetical protein
MLFGGSPHLLLGHGCVACGPLLVFCFFFWVLVAWLGLPSVMGGDTGILVRNLLT